MVRRLEEELDSANGESRHLSAELVRTTARYERAQEHNTKTMNEVSTLTGDLEEANLTVHGHALRNIDLMSRLDALRHQLDDMAIDKKFLHASTQTDPLPSVVTKRLDVNFGIMSAMKSASKSHPEVIPVLQVLMKEEVIQKSRLKTSLRTQMGVHNCFGDRKKPERFAPYRKPRKDITCDTLKMKILEFCEGLAECYWGH